MATTRKKTAEKPVESVDTEPDTEDAVEELQHPALDGDKSAEVEQRTADGPDGKHGTTFHKTFRVTLPDETVPADQVEWNKIRVVEEAIQRGLHPTEQPQYAGRDVVGSHRRTGVTIDLHYTVAVEPAVTDTDAPNSVSPSDVVLEEV